MSPKVNTDPKLIDELLTRGVENVYPNPEELRKVLSSGTRLRLYNGIDPTGPTLHLGHAVVLRKLKQFQDLGHEVILLIGDFTGMIGDPTDKLAARQQQTRAEVLANCKNYKKQAGKILNFKDKLNPVKLMFNSQWQAKLKFSEALELAAKFTVQRMLDRDMFKKRLAEGKDLYLHELLYPLMQAYDSVAMDVDLEVGGNDQMFNMLCGRTLMKKMKNKEKFVLTMKLLEDSSGKKMGKTEGNLISLDDSAEEMYGKVMSWPDGLIWPGLEILTEVPMAEIDKMKKTVGNPRDYKMRLARELIGLYHGKRAALDAEANFIKTIRNHETPNDVIDFEIKDVRKMKPIDILVKTGLCVSRGDARRVIRDKGMSINGKIIEPEQEGIKIDLKDGDIIKKGKLFFRRISDKT